MCDAPSESYTWTDEVNVEGAVADASRLVVIENWVVATGARSRPGGTVIVGRRTAS